MKKLLCGKLYDGITPQLQDNMEILIDGKYILDVGRNLSCPENTSVIDLSSLTVTPGMIDAHVHPQFFDYNDIYRDTVFNSDGHRALATYYSAQQALSGGFTTIRSMGWFRESYELDVKRAIDRGYLPGARMVVAAHLLGTSGSHGDMSQIAYSNPQVCDFLESCYSGTGNGADFFRAAVRREKKLGSDFIKIMATGGFATPNDDPNDIQMSDSEFQAIFETARELGMTVTAHVYGPKLMQKLLGYGIDGMEHGSMMDEETARMFEASGTYLVPTFSPFQEIFDMHEEELQKKSPAFQNKLHLYRDRLLHGRQCIIDSSIKLGYGTDLVSVHQNYECGWEYNCMIRSGMDPFRILQAATKNNAEICGLDSKVGTIESGKYADISGWRRDLLTDPDALRECAFVMKEGCQYQAKSFIEMQ